MSFSHGYVFFHIFITICLPNGSQAELTVCCGLSLSTHSCLPAQALTEPKLQPGRLWAQGHQRWDKFQFQAPGALLSRTVQTSYWQGQSSYEQDPSNHVYAGYERTIAISKDTLKIKQKPSCLAA